MEGVQDVDHMAEETSSDLKRIVQSSVLDSFSELESNLDDHRTKAGVALLRSLYQKQRESEDEGSCREVIYSLRRLVRGLATSNKFKRAGFFSVLVEIFNLFPCITIQDVMSLVDKELAHNSNCSKKEITEIYSGQILVFGALIHSNFLHQKAKSVQIEILAKLVAAGQKKNILIPSVCSFLLEFIQKTDEESFRTIVWPLLKSELDKTWEQHTLDSFYLLLKVRKQFPGVVKKKFLAQTLGSKELFSEDSIVSCSKFLMKTSFVENHPVYEEVISQVITADSTIPFWESLVQEYKEHQQKEQRLLCFLNHLLQHVPNKTKIPEFLCDSFMEMVVKTFHTKRIQAKLAHQACEMFTEMSKLLESDEIDDKIRILFIQRILFYPGHLMFDQLAGTQILVNLSSCMKSEGIRKIGKMLQNVISAHMPKVKNAQGETCSWSVGERSYAAQLFTRWLSLPVMEENTEWKFKQLKFLISIGFVASPSREPGDIVNIAVAAKVRNCIFKLLNQKVSKVSRLIMLLTSIVFHLHEILFLQENPLKLRQPLTEASVAAWKKMIAFVKEIESVKDDVAVTKLSGRHMFLVLFLHMGLQLFQNASLAEEALEELHCCYEKTKIPVSESEKITKKGKNGVTKEDEPYWVEVIVDLLLSLLSRNSYLLRNVVGVVFPHLCPHLTPASVYQIVKILDPHGKQPLSNTDTEDDSEDETVEEESGSEEDETIEEESGSEDNDDAPVDSGLKIAVHNALKKAGGGCSGSDEESVDMDTMTEEQRDGLDAALSEAFSLVKHNRANQKIKKQSKDDETLMHFRVRVTDMLDVFLANQPSLSLVLDIMLPLFELLEFCIKDDHQKPLENRVRACIRKLSEVKHFSNMVGVDQELLSLVLNRLLQKGEWVSTVYQSMGEPLIQCATFLARTSHYLEQQASTPSPSKSSPVLNVFKEALTTFFERRDSLLPLDVFKSVLVLSWKGAWKLAEDILGFAFHNEVRPFRRHQALELLVVFFSSGRLLVDIQAMYLKKLITMEQKVSENVLGILMGVMENKEKQDAATNVKEKYIKELLNLLYAIWHAHNRCKDKGPRTAVDWTALKTAVSCYWEATSVATDTRIALKKLASALQIDLSKKSVTSEKKKSKNLTPGADNGHNEESKHQNENGDLSLHPESENEGDGNQSDNDSDNDTGDKGYESGNDEKNKMQNDENVEKVVKKRKRPKTDNLKGKAILKKQSKAAHFAAVIPGLDNSVNFSAVNIKELEKVDNETEDEDNSDVIKKKKKKHSSKADLNDEFSVGTVMSERKVGWKEKRLERKVERKVGRKGRLKVKSKNISGMPKRKKLKVSK